MEILALACAPFGWMFISKLERSMVILTSIEGMIAWKIFGKPIVSIIIGWAVAPFYILGFIFKKIFLRKA